MAVDFRFDEKFLKQLETLEFRARRLVQGSFLAQRRTGRQGGGVEFAEHRNYSDGDDLRDFDWNAYARLGQLLTKRYTEEQDLPVYLLLDCSRSMAVGKPPKFDTARRVVAALAYLTLASLDTCSIVAFAGGVHAVLAPTRGKNRILGVLRFLQELRADGPPTDLVASMTEFANRTTKRGLAVVVSDWFDRNGVRAGVEVLRIRQFDVHAIQLFDAAEQDPRLRGDIDLFDVERGQTRGITVDESTLRRYRQAFLAHQRQLEEHCLKHSLGCTMARACTPLEELVLGTMRGARILN